MESEVPLTETPETTADIGLTEIELLSLIADNLYAIWMAVIVFIVIYIFNTFVRRR